VEGLGKESGFGGGILAVRDGGADAAPARRLSVRLGVVAFVAEHRRRGDVRANVEQDLEVAAVAGLAAGQAEGQRQRSKSNFRWILVEKPPRERPRACPFCPLLRPLPRHGRARSSNRPSGRGERCRSFPPKGRDRLENAPPAQPPKPLPDAVPNCQTQPATL